MPDYWTIIIIFLTNSCTYEMHAEEYRCLVEEEESVRYSDKASSTYRSQYKLGDKA